MKSNGGECESEGASLLGGCEVECAEDDFPGEVHGVPEFGVKEAEGCGVAPEGGDVTCVGGEGLEGGAGVCAEEGGELVEFWAGCEGLGDGSVGVGGGEGREEGGGEGDEGREERGDGVGVDEGVDERERGGAGEGQGNDGEGEEGGTVLDGWRGGQTGEVGAVGGEDEGVDGHEGHGLVRGGGLRGGEGEDVGRTGGVGGGRGAEGEREIGREMGFGEGRRGEIGESVEEETGFYTETTTDVLWGYVLEIGGESTDGIRIDVDKLGTSESTREMDGLGSWKGIHWGSGKKRESIYVCDRVQEKDRKGQRLF